MAAVGNVLIQLSTKLGPGGLASLESGLNMVTGFKNAVQDTVAELDAFKTVLARVDMEMVNYADAAAQGQVDTLALMKGLNKLNEAGAKPTEEQFKTLTVRTVELAKATDQDATEAFERLTTGIAKGSSRALTEYGVKLKESTDLQETQKEALDQLTSGYEDLTVEVETGTERMYALSNAWDTSLGLMWDAMTQGGSTLGDAIGDVTANLNELNTYLSSLTDGTKAYMFSVDGAIDQVKTSFAGLFQYMAEFHDLMGSEAAATGLRKFSTDLLAQVKQARKEAGGVDFDENYGPQQIGPRGGGTKSGKRGKEGFEVEPSIGVSPQAQRWADSLGIPLNQDTMAWYEDFARRMGGMSMGMEGPATARREGQGFGEADWSKASTSVDEKMAELIALEERREHVQAGALDRLAEYMELRSEELLSLQEISLMNENHLSLLQDEEYQEARLQEMREGKLIYEAEMEIHRAFERERALDFAHQFTQTWKNSYKVISAGATAVGHIQDLLKASWSSLIRSVITGTGSWKEALKEVLIAKGIAIAIEEGWLGLSDTVAAVSAFARRQYSKGTMLLASAAGHYALAGIAGAASGVASRIGGAGSSGGAAATVPSSTPTFSGGGYSGAGEAREVTHIIKLDDSAGEGMFRMVREENTRQQISGGTSFHEDEGA